MLEGQSCLISRVLPRNCEQENKWVYMTYLIEVPNGKRRSEDEGEEGGRRKLSKQLVKKLGDETTQSLTDFHLSPTDHHDYNNHGKDGDQSDSSSLIQSLGRDVSINCLLHCSRSDYNSLASLNQSFRSLIRGGELYKLRQKMGVIEHWVYFSCHLLEWEAFDPNRRRWMHLPRMPSMNASCALIRSL